jgi:hypothetical protein
MLQRSTAPGETIFAGTPPLVHRCSSGPPRAFAGYFLIRHFPTRVLLWATDRGPWDYVEFLDAAAERVFLRKLGGGYIFVHRALLEYMARQPRGS